MQPGREDNLETRYAIRFGVKLGKNTAETSNLLQTVYVLTCLIRASDFRRHKRLEDVGEYVRDDKRCGRETITCNFDDCTGNGVST